MKRTKPLRHTPIRRRWEGPTTAEREPRPMAKLERAPNYGPAELSAAPKAEPQRNARLLAMANGKPCLLIVPGRCNYRTDTTVAAHSNWSEHGKASARKAEDHWSAWACFACHSWLDAGAAPAEQRRAIFMDGMGRQIAMWRLIAADPAQSEADRRAARWALERHEGGTT